MLKTIYSRFLTLKNFLNKQNKFLNFNFFNILLLILLTIFIDINSTPVVTLPFPMPTLNVGPDGKLSTGILIELPVNTNEILPSMGISYSSNTSSGIMGVGWNFTGFPVIMRDPSFGINSNNNDRFLSSLG